MERTIEVYSGKGNRERKLIKDEIRTVLKKSRYCFYATHDFEVIFAELPGDTLGRAYPEDELILLSSRLLNAEHGIIRNVALHEVAHIIEYRSTDRSGHGPDFKRICSDLGLDGDYARAKVDMAKHDRLLDKISKLEALSQSPFSEEAASAMMKIRQLTAQYGITADEDGDDRICSTVLFDTKRLSTKANILLSIVKELTGIYVVLINDYDVTHVTAYGSYETLEVASYLFDSLQYRIDFELKMLKKQKPGAFRGAAATNGFYMGVLEAIRKRKETTQEDRTAGKELVIISNRNEELAQKYYFNDKGDTVYERKRSSFSYDPSSREAGLDYGKNLDTRPGIKNDGTRFLE
ncbi:MAG: SprT-like domain-containing protein [Bullifex sp.]